MKLTADQIEELYLFTRQHYVEYFDVQTELVDHLANCIEVEWQENPKIPFDEALNKEFKKFGVFGFMNVVEQKQKQLLRKYHSIIWSHFKEFFGIPKIILTASLTGIIYMILKKIEEPKSFVLGWLIVIIGVFFYNSFQNKKRLKKGNRKWLFKEIIFNYGSFGMVSIFTFQMINLSVKWILNPSFFLMFLALIMVLLSIYCYLSVYIIPSKAEEYLKQTYPEYELL